MPHDFLNDFQIGFIFAAAVQNVCLRLWTEKSRISSGSRFSFSASFTSSRLWSLIIRLIARFIVIGLEVLLPVRKNKIGISIYRRRFQLEPFLILTFLKQRFPHLWQHRNYTIASVRFGRCKTEPPTIVVTETVNNIMVDENLIILKITIIPSKTNRFTNPTSRSKQKCKQWHPVAINRRGWNKLNKCCLFCLCQCMPLWLLPTMAFLDITLKPVCGLQRI